MWQTVLNVPSKSILPCSLLHGCPAKDDSSEPPLQPGEATWLSGPVGREGKEGGQLPDISFLWTSCLSRTLALYSFLQTRRQIHQQSSFEPADEDDDWEWQGNWQKLDLFLFFFNRNVVDLQCCVNFCRTAKWFSYTYIYILFYILFHYGLSQDIEYSSLCYTVGPCCLSSLYILACIC